MKKLRVLWIDEEADVDLAPLCGPVYVSGRYDLQIAYNATDAERALCEGAFEIAVVDIRIPPGTRAEWIDLYKHHEQDRVAARLGMRLLEGLFAPAKSAITLAPARRQLLPHSFAVLSVESRDALLPELQALGISHCSTKQFGVTTRLLLDVIDGIARTLPATA